MTEITSVTTKRKKLFDTPIGRFTYVPIPVSLFATGFTWFKCTNAESAFIATLEKALADLFYIRHWKITSHADLEALLFDDLRLDLSLVKKLRIGVLEDILRAKGSPLLIPLISWLRRTK